MNLSMNYISDTDTLIVLMYHLFELPPLPQGAVDQNWQTNIRHFLDNQAEQGRKVLGMIETDMADEAKLFISNFCSEPGSSSEHGTKPQSLRLTKFFYRNASRMRLQQEEGMIPLKEYFNITNMAYFMGEQFI